MARLQYALLAEYAKVDAGGLLTVVGAGFDRVVAQRLPSHQTIGVALRAQLAEDDTDATAVVTLSPPAGLTLRVEMPLKRPPNARPIAGYVGVALATNFTVPLVAAGVYHCSIGLADGEQQDLSFEVEVSGAAQQGGA